MISSTFLYKFTILYGYIVQYIIQISVQDVFPYPYHILDAYPSTLSLEGLMLGHAPTPTPGAHTRVYVTLLTETFDTLWELVVMLDGIGCGYFPGFWWVS